MRLTGSDAAVVWLLQLERQHVVKVVLSKDGDCLEQPTSVGPEGPPELLVVTVHRVPVYGGGDRVELLPRAQPAITSRSWQS